MAGIGVCSIDDIAISVLATVIGHQVSKGWTIVDAGWMAMSRDRGTARQAVDQGYGVVCDLTGKPFDQVLLQEANQEHGVLTLRKNSSQAMPCLPVGSKVRILPNHACATSAQHEQYVVLGRDNQVIDSWPRISGW
jgi:D-serine deaminase-like pyridoxal phosphate-dependent protein